MADCDISEEIFKKLHRDRRTGGTRLGLSIVQAIVQRHHGSITAS